MSRAIIVAGLALAVAGCGGKDMGLEPADSGNACIAIGADGFCGAQYPCCSGGWCDVVAGHCRDAAQCGVSGQGCDPDHPCCSGMTCNQNQCAYPHSTGTSSGGTTGGSCQGLGSGCSINAQCCSGVCASALGACVQPTNTSGGTSSGGTSSGGTSGGTCFGAGTSCSSGTQCCSGACNGGICG